MARSASSTLIRLVVLVVAVVVGVRYGSPWFRSHFSRSSASHTEAGVAGSSPCVASARAASELWGGGIGRFANPSPDLGAWDAFRSDVDGAISRASSDCSCPDDSCSKARDAVDALRSLTGEFDSAIRTGGSLPGDVVQRQESIDTTLDQAQDLADQGK
ncbi:MAG: hypothetical protein WBX15_13425 [Thermoanaerobaculia bacterium]